MSETDTLPSRRMADAAIRWIRDLGFPIVVCLYLLIGLAPKIERLTELVQRLVIITEARRP